MGKCDSYTRILQMNPPYDYYLKVAPGASLTSQFKFCRALCILRNAAHLWRAIC